MPNVLFILKEPKSTNETLVYLYFIYRNRKLKYSTGQTINPKLWNFKTHRVRENRSFPEYPEFNAYLNKLETETQNFYRQSFVNGVLPTINDIREYLNKNVTFRAKLEPQPEKVTLFSFFETALNEKKQTLTHGTTKTHLSTLNHLKGYAKDRNITLDFDGITLEFFHDFVKYLYAPPRELGANYAAKNIQILKQYLLEATERGHNANRTFQNRKFKIEKQNVHDIHLSEKELQRIFDFDLSDKPTGFSTVRDLFLIGCYTGLRFSDWAKVRKDQIQTSNGNKIIRITPQKTKESVTIPLHPVVMAILDKYVDILPKPLTNQKTNQYIKDIAQWVGIDSNVVLGSNKAGKPIDIEAPKYQFIGTHTARRSFATNAYLKGVDVLVIRSITGHTTEREFLKYIKISSDTKANLMAKTDFFKNAKTE